MHFPVLRIADHQRTKHLNRLAAGCIVPTQNHCQCLAVFRVLRRKFNRPAQMRDAGRTVFPALPAPPLSELKLTCCIVWFEFDEQCDKPNGFLPVTLRRKRIAQSGKRVSRLRVCGEHLAPEVGGAGKIAGGGRGACLFGN
ncbi:MAG TPA: hypothetical protein VNL38_02495 [Candidatus Nitrosotenuis sp.]|nr:hypothetical protein [Candidatus Nitrosotenuis sp.]